MDKKKSIKACITDVNTLTINPNSTKVPEFSFSQYINKITSMVAHKMHDQGLPAY
ncbi:hypothetical protein [Peribacillus sp. V2I11]|uniref:hypothetical protein n=1 Tax=Peribacillus sp. V2I11 TaxID=3042277 RepID=UPI00278B84CC|nr:hypothetical protein [Peribacillus sp. V2I11]MDQ0883730.1 hypothetical protein [Peribacillus sp. V2I11]